MVITFSPSQVIPKYVTYILQDQQGRDVFIWHAKFIEVTQLRDAIKNPAFDPSLTYNLYLMTWHDDARAAYNQTCAHLTARGWPELNKTQQWNLHGYIVCNETGQQWLKQADLIRQISIDQSTLSKHLKRAPGFASIKGMTYSRVNYRTSPTEQSVKPPKSIHLARQRNKWIKCNESSIPYRNQREACAALNLNAGQLSQHLQGHAGYKTVKGLTFSYCDAPTTAPQFKPVQYP